MSFKFLGKQEVPPFSTLNADIIPTPDLLASIEKHQAKIDPELVAEILKTVGMQSSDERVHKMISAMVEIQLLKIVQELKTVAPTQVN